MVRGDNLQHIDNLSIFNYPRDIITKDKSLIENLFQVHDFKELKTTNNKKSGGNNQQQFLIDDPIPQKINSFNASTICINGDIIIGLIFENDDDPNDYENYFKDLIDELVINEKRCSFHEEFEIDNFLITTFIDLRRYDDEIMQKASNLDISIESPFNKAFLFGIDEVGKSSLVRRIKTGEYNDNYFTPTKKFNIQYIKNEGNGLLAIWDMPGQYSFRKKWLTGSQDSNILIYMIDVSDQIRFAESRKELDLIINHYELSEIPLLIIGNKIDLVNHVNINDIKETKNHLIRLRKEIFEYFHLDELNNRKWKFLFTSVKANFNMKKMIQSMKELISY